MRIHINGIPSGNRQIVVSVPDPGIGADFSYTIPQGSGYILESVVFSYACNATAANRVMRFRVKRGSTVYAAGAAISAVTALGTGVIFWCKDTVSSNATTTSLASPLPQLPALEPGDIIESAVVNLQTGGAGDTISAIALTFTLPQ